MPKQNEKTMNQHEKHHPTHLIFNIAVFTLVVFFAVYILFISSKPNTKKVTNFEDCVSAGNPVMESYPRKCVTHDGKSFTENIQTNQVIDTVASGSASKTGEFKPREKFVINNQSDWEALWNRIHVNEESRGPVPSVNFDNYVVLAVFSGEKNTGGYGIQITDVKNVGGFNKVEVTETSPGAYCSVTQATTSPFHVVKYNISEQEPSSQKVGGSVLDERNFEFIFSEKVVDCQNT